MKSISTPNHLADILVRTVQGILALLISVNVTAHGIEQLLDTEVTLSLHNVPFDQALKEIERAAKIKFVYSADQLGTIGDVTIEANARPLRDVLNDLLTPRNIQYNIHEKDAAITLKRRSEARGNAGSGSPLGNRPPTVTGIVRDAVSGQTMAGVNVVVKGTTIGTTTDSEGHFSIAADEGATLVFSFIGYRSWEMKVGGQSSLEIQLQEDVRNLNEVVVNAGYYTTTKETQTGNIAKIEAREIQTQPVSNPVAALQGRVPGLEVIQSNGIPGGGFKVRIRGTNSIGSGNDPLYIVDGVPFTSTTLSVDATSGNILGSSDPSASLGYSPLNSLNPSDIESIEVLKDADATSIYGSRGANGVILITTKKGKAGQTKVDFNFYMGGAVVPKTLNLLSTPQYLSMRREAFANDKVTPTPINAPDLLLWDTTRYTDWQKEFIGGTANITDAQLSISGGERNTQFVVGTGYHRETTVFPGSNSAQRISVHTSLTNKAFSDRLSTTVSINYSMNKTTLPGRDLTSNALNLAPNAPLVRDESGNLSWTNWTSTVENPLVYIKRPYEGTTNNLIGNAVIAYSILPQLIARVNMGYTAMGMNSSLLQPISSMNPSAQNKINSAVYSSSSFQNWIIEPQLNWKPRLGAGQFDALLGATFMDQTTQAVTQFGTGFSSEALLKVISAATTITSGTTYYNQYRYQSAFGRINYNLNDRYIINATGRRDGSSRFGPGRQYAFFGAVGAAWIFSKENFIRNAIPGLSFGKIRGSYGTTGNDQIGDYQYLDTYKISGVYQTTTGVGPARLANQDFGWETNKKIEGAIDLAFLNDRLWWSVAYYVNRSSSQLIGYPLAPTTGFPSIQSNFPAVVQNRGFEFALTTRNIESGKMTWTTSINYTLPRNRLVSFPNIEGFPIYAQKYVVGQPLDIDKVYHSTGVSPATGLYTFQDFDNSAGISPQDRQVARFIGRNHYGGMLNTIRYSGFQLDFAFQYVNQQGYTVNHLFGTPGTLANQTPDVLGRWQKAGDVSKTQLFTRGGTGTTTYDQFVASDASIADASFLRLKNVSLSYSIPQQTLQRAHIVTASLFVQCQNLVTWTKYKGINPEWLASTLPPLRTITAGIHLTL